jgi:hyperosmotically inducible protein
MELISHLSVTPNSTPFLAMFKTWRIPMKSLVIPLLAIWTIVGCTQSSPTSERNPNGEVDARSSSAKSVRKDNTEINKRDRSAEKKTPLDQNEDQKDIDISASIRKRVVDSDLSTSAKNSKIITQDGKVTLRGPVKTDEEKKKIEAIAVDVAGAEKVDNQLEVQP